MGRFAGMKGLVLGVANDHSIAFAPLEDLKGETTNCSREGFRLAMETSAYSLLAVGRLVRDILSKDASILTLTYFGGEKVVPGYNIMGVCKACLLYTSPSPRDRTRSRMPSSA